jgi:hypothetical protein
VQTRSTRIREVGIDTLDAAGVAANGAKLRAEGLSFAMIYVERATPAIVQAILAADLALAFLSEARVSGWSAASGTIDGKLAASRMLALGVPPSVSLGCDMESGVPGVPDEATAVTYANAWYRAAIAEGMHADAPDLYVGYGSGFVTPKVLYEKIAFRRYHKSLSDVITPERRGYCMMQLFPGDQMIAGVLVDFDVAQEDFFQDTLTLLTR